MAERTALACALLLGPAFAGCLGGPGDGPAQPSTTPRGDHADLAVPDDLPDGATLRRTGSGLQLRFEDVALPFRREVPIPEGTTVVDLRATADDGTTELYPSLLEATTGAARCTTRETRTWKRPPTGSASCAGVAVLDPRPTTWTARVRSARENPAARATSVTIQLYAAPLDGLLSRVDVDALSAPTHGLGPTTTHRVESHDGTELHVAVHRPAEGDDAYPTVLISTPYRTSDEATGELRYEGLVQDLVRRGYAVAVAEVRGTGRSGGCADVWGEAGQRDQVALVRWVRSQGFSDGRVAMYGKSYGGITATAAAVRAPEGLEAVIPVASNYDAYRDWHYGGVPNGENVVTPPFYQGLGTATRPRPTAPAETAAAAANGACDPTLSGRANDPRWTYDAFYRTRDFARRADQVEAAVLTQHGFVDGNVKPSVVPGWFSDLEAPKLGLFGQWGHVHAVRADQATLRLAWLDQFLKGRDLGLAGISRASVEANQGYRSSPDWPPAAATDRTLYPALGAGGLRRQPTNATASLLLEPTGAEDAAPGSPAGPDQLVLTREVRRPFALAGAPSMTLDVTLEGAANAFVSARLYEVGDQGDRLVTYGQANLAHRGNHTTYEPLTPRERVQVPLPLQPTQYQLDAGDRLRLVVEASDLPGRAPTHPGRLVLHGGADGTALTLPSLGPGAHGRVPLTVDPSPAT